VIELLRPTASRRLVVSLLATLSACGGDSDSDTTDVIGGQGYTGLARPDTLDTPENWSAVIAVLANDATTVPQQAQLEVAVAPTGGRATVVQSETLGSAIRYTPDWHFNGTDRFRYRIREGADEIGSAEVTVLVRPAIRITAGGRAYDVALDVESGPTGFAPPAGVMPEQHGSELADVDHGGRMIGRTLRSGVWTGVEGTAGAMAEVQDPGADETRLQRFDSSGVAFGASRHGGVEEAIEWQAAVVGRWRVSGATGTQPAGTLTDGTLIMTADTGAGPRLHAARSDTLEPFQFPVDGAVRALSAGGTRITGVLGDGAGFVLEGDTLITAPPVDGGEVRVEDVGAAGGELLYVGSERVGARGWRGFVSSGLPARSSFDFAFALDTWAHGTNGTEVVGAFRDLLGFVRSYRLTPAQPPPVGLELEPESVPVLGSVDHACGHAADGPFADVLAMETVSAAGESELARGHVAYRVTMPPGGGPQRGFVSLRPSRAGQTVSLFVDHLVPIVVRAPDGTVVVPEAGERSAHCDGILYWLQVLLSAEGTHVVELGPTSVPSVQIVFERSGVVR